MYPMTKILPALLFVACGGVVAEPSDPPCDPCPENYVDTEGRPCGCRVDGACLKADYGDGVWQCLSL